ncbi:hypothetical protein EOB36_18215 [Mesorhizobium sp. M6A.T.Cr.TU.017.01.1.1]|uniref:hypothetical protein n=1 Tax=Mesorhizobium sp. M6A.T.Cr.TU.017.01.1.1 TaxID=2496774 RepID=UPI000FD4A0D6|nr:hypothetical protein [Mesorhizobium sp. M6A.T.Cr.TU.017.01.1.1]RUV00079.1 hypothetical protein EOB36_18215 [Mesorhizobium sp. M6A.T.Cr.TU.017.01.1.1]
MQIKLIIAGLVALAFLGLFSAAAVYRGNAIKAEAETARLQGNLDKAVDANKVSVDTIDRMQKQDAANDKIAADLALKLAAANTALIETTTARADLKGKDENVRSYLDAPVPDSLRRLYDH